MVWSIENEDCDPSLFLTNYLFDRYEHNIEQKLWVCWLYGTTYYLPTAWVIWNEFPDFELVDQQRLEKWNAENYRRLRYQTDTKYNKGHLPAQFASYRNWVHSSATDQRSKLREFAQKDRSPTENFNALYAEVTNNLHKFGRYTGWFYLQTLKHCAGVPIDAPDLKLSDYSGSRSHRNGLLYALGFDELIDKPLSAKQYATFETLAKMILIEVKEKLKPEYKDKADLFAMETCLCSFKKLFRVKRGRYLGYYLDRQALEIQTVENDGWDGIYWKPFWDGRNETIKDKSLLGGKIEEGRMSQFLDFGTIHRVQYQSDSNLLDFFR
jgi:hypothetical protein